MVQFDRQNKPNEQEQSQSLPESVEATASDVKTFSSASQDDFKGFTFDTSVNADEEDFMRIARAQAYMDVIALIDLTSSTDEEVIAALKENVDEDVIEEFLDMSADEIMEELRLSFEEEMGERMKKLEMLPEPQKLLYVICKCYITGCDVHSINKNGAILEHYNLSGKYNEKIEFGRKLYHRHNGCLSVEIYSNCCRVIGEGGAVIATVGYEE